MTEFGRQTPPGRTGLKIGRLGVSSRSGAPAEAVEETFDRGCSYFTCPKQDSKTDRMHAIGAHIYRS